MSTETTTTVPPAPAPADRSEELVNRLLKLPEQTKLDLAALLLDSVREGFTSLAESEKRDTDLIRSRLEELMSGKVELLDANEVVAKLKARYSKEKAS